MANIKSKRHAMLGALFCQAQERGISSEQLRDEIAPGLIGRRLSAASEKQIGLVLAHIAGPRPKLRTPNSGRSYTSSLKGLRDEICDLARERFGESWELPLNNFCVRFGVKRWQWLNVSHGRAVKAALVRLQNVGRGTLEVGRDLLRPSEADIPHPTDSNEEVPF